MSHQCKDQRKAYIHPDDDEILLFIWDKSMSGWMPDMEVMNAYFTGLIRVYQPYDDLIVTMDMSGGRLEWPVMQEASEVQEMRSLLERPWINMGTVYTYTVLGDRSIEEFDNWYRNPVTTPTSDRWESVIRPTLEYERRPQAPAPAPAPSAPPAEDPPTQPKLPPHVVRILIDKAVQEGAVCSITREPITTKNAAVTSCGHIFTDVGLRGWSRSCPECRAPL
jgi:hypothetical protein